MSTVYTVDCSALAPKTAKPQNMNVVNMKLYYIMGNATWLLDLNIDTFFLDSI